MSLYPLEDGTSVKVIDSGHTYTSWSDLARLFKLLNWRLNESPSKGRIYTIQGNRKDAYNPNLYIYGIVDLEGNGYLINEHGIKNISTPSLDIDNTKPVEIPIQTFDPSNLSI